MAPDTIVRREPATLSKPMQSAVSKMFDETVINDTVVEQLTYRSHDGLKIKGYIARPKHEGLYPVLIWNRGGYKDGGALDDLRAHLILASTAVWGYVVLATQYRGNMGSQGEEDWGGRDLDDSLRLIDVAGEVDQADTSRMAIEGASRGGMTTYRALAQDHPFKCAIVHAGISDLVALQNENEDFARLLEKRFGNAHTESSLDELKKRSGVYLARRFKKNVPILLMHGTNDKTVPPSQTESLADQLREAGVEHKQVMLRGAGHVALKDGSYKEVDRHRQAWLTQYLGSAAD